MNAVIEHGTPLVDDPERVGAVTQLGVDETSLLSANRDHAVGGQVHMSFRVQMDV
jgi:hypothetical protein